LNIFGRRRRETMDVAEWQSRLENYFKVNGITGKPLLPVLAMESDYGRYVVETFLGQFVLMDSFFAFFIETVNRAVTLGRSKKWPPEYSTYPLVLQYYITVFRSFRAAENLLKCGYPLDGYALLRDLKDRAIFAGALAHGKTSFYKLFGSPNVQSLTSITQKEYRQIKKRCKDEERRVLNEMIRRESGFPSDVQKELEAWENLFHEEVHGSRLTFAKSVGWLQGTQPLSLGPIPDEGSIAVYVNRASEIGWLFLRTFPFLQLESDAFGREWREKYTVLDDSFRIMVQALGSKGKKIGEIFLALVSAKFTFPDDLHYHE
jgi:hypothetical protein